MNLTAPLLLLLLGATSTSAALFCSSNFLRLKEEWSFSRRSEGGQGSIGLLGDVNDVLQGLLRPEASHTEWNLSSLGEPIGLGAGDVGGDSSLRGLGEALLLNGHAYVRSTDNGSAHYFKTVSTKTYRSPFSVLVLQGCTADAQVTFHSQDVVMTLADFYSRVNSAAGGASFCYAGFTEFVSLEGVAVSKAPIHREPLFGPTQRAYYTQPPFHLTHQYAYVAGCAANFSAVATDAELTRKLRKLLYINPLDTGVPTALQTHSHAVSLKRCSRSVDNIRPGDVDGVFHLLSNSTLNFIDAQVFFLNGTGRLVEMGEVRKEEDPRSPGDLHPPSPSSGGSLTSPLLLLLSASLLLTRLHF